MEGLFNDGMLPIDHLLRVNKVCQKIPRLLVLVALLMDKGGSRTAATSKMECFVIIANGWNPLTIITKHSILDVAAALDPPLIILKDNVKTIEMPN